MRFGSRTLRLSYIAASIGIFTALANFQLPGIASAASSQLPPEAPPALQVSSLSIREPSSTKNVVLLVELDRPAETRATVRYSTVDRTATAGSDYHTRSGRITFSPGQTRKSVVVTLIGDAHHEADETLAIVFDDPVGMVADNEATITIQDDDPVPAPTVNAVSQVIKESNAIYNARLTIELTHPAQFRTSVSYSTVSRTAQAGLDYNMRSGTVAFAAGQTRKQITITILGDAEWEPDEHFLLTLSNGNGVRLGENAVITMADDDPKPEVVVTAVSAQVRESWTARNIELRFELSATPIERVTVNYQTVDGDATDGEDYNGRSGTIVFGVGQTVKQVPLTVLSDGRVESTESFRVQMSDPVGLTLGQNAVVTIVDLGSLIS